MSSRWPRACSKRFCVLLFLLVVPTVPVVARAEDGQADGGEAASSASGPTGVAELRAIENQVQKVVAEVLPHTLAVRVGNAQGSGVLVSEEGYVLTAGHVAQQPGQEVTFIFPDGKTARGTTLGINRRADAGLARITDEGPWPSLQMGTSTDVPKGAWCVAVGHPLGFQTGRPPVVRVGRLIRSEETMIQTDCPLVAGDSGGPLFDLEGKIIGINSRIASSTSVNFHVPIDVYHDCWDRLVKGEAWEDGIPGKDSSQVKSVFRELVTDAGTCTVRVKCDGKDAALGTIVGPDGWIVTKASELKGRIVCHHRDGRQSDARLVGVDPKSDLAMLKVEATELPVISWSEGEDPSVGQWVAAAGVEDGPPMAIGVVGAPRMAIPPASGVLGVVVGNAPKGAKIIEVLAKSAAQKAGLEVDDVITHLNGEPVQKQGDVISVIKGHQPGDVVEVTVRRDAKSLELSATLTKLDTPEARKRDMQNRSDVGISKRHDGFPTVLQHDTVLRPVDCGGPLVDLSGRVIGVNIARAGRTETYCIPSDVLLSLMYDLISGRLAPPKPESPAAVEDEAEPEDAAESENEPESAEPDKEPLDEKKQDAEEE